LKFEDRRRGLIGVWKEQAGGTFAICLGNLASVVAGTEPAC
jgi:hypothetical protein